MSSELNAEVSISKIDIDFFSSVTLEGLEIYDQEGELMIAAPIAKIRIEDFSISGDFLSLKSVELREGQLNVYRSIEEKDFNYQFLVDYFENDNASSSNDFKIDCAQLDLSNMHVKFRDEHGLLESDKIDFSNLDLDNVCLSLSDFNSEKSATTFKLTSLTFTEKKGFEIKNFDAQVTITPEFVSLDRILAVTNQSTLSCKSFKFGLGEKLDIHLAIDSSSLDFSDVNAFFGEFTEMKSNIQIAGDFNVTENSFLCPNYIISTNSNAVQGEIFLRHLQNTDSLHIDAKIHKSTINLVEVLDVLHAAGFDSLSIPESIQNEIKDLTLENLAFNGTLKDAIVEVQRIMLDGGEINILPTSVGIDLTNSTFDIIPSKEPWVSFKNLDLSSLSGTNVLGKVTGEIGSGPIRVKDDQFAINSLALNLSNLEINQASYSNLSLVSNSLTDQKGDFTLHFDDKYVQLNLKSDFTKLNKNSLDINVVGDMKNFNLGKMGLIENDSLTVSSNFKGKLLWKNEKADNVKIVMNNTLLNNGNGILDIDKMEALYENKSSEEALQVQTDYFDINIHGKYDSRFLIDNLLQDVASYIPISLENNRKTHPRKDNLEMTLNIKDDFRRLPMLFGIDFDISKNALFSMSYSSELKDIEIEFRTDYLNYGDLSFSNVTLDQSFDKEQVKGSIQSKKVFIDSIYFDQVVFKNQGDRQNVDAAISWNIDGHDESELKWNTLILGKDLFSFTIQPSFFTLNNFRWEIADSSFITKSEKNLYVDNFALKRNDQSIYLNGCLSDNTNDQFKFLLNNIDLQEISTIIGLDYELKGSFSGFSTIKKPLDDLEIETDAFIDNLFISGQEVGTVYISPYYSMKKNMVNFNGSLTFQGIETFVFDGKYLLKEESIAAGLNFEDTDIQFCNAFLDPEIISDIQGKLNGRIDIAGNITKPSLSGDLELNSGGLIVPITNVEYKVNGGIRVRPDGIDVDYIPVFDDEGNEARLIATVNHENYSNFNFDVQVLFDLDPSESSNYKFKVLDTKYQDGEYYYGKAYTSGTFDISGNEDLVRIELNAETKTGTEIIFPIYGAEEFEENDDFIQFISNNLDSSLSNEIDLYSGVDMDFNFKVNKNALMKLVFDETTGDQLETKGFGDISLKIDPMYNMTMLGTYNITEGSKYNFAMGSFKQPFDINSGSSIKWNGGDVTEAQLDVRASIRLNRVSLLELSPELVDRSLASQEVICALTLKDNLMQPTIGFDIKAPKAPEGGKALIRKVVEDVDELNKQFFSLLLIKKFQPLKGSVNANGSAALDVLETQINDLLGKISGKYKLNVGYGRDDVINETSATFGLKTGFFNDRLLVSGTFGVDGIGSSSESGSTDFTNSIIGDVNIEYLINEKGSFRLNAFNESSSSSNDALNVDNSTGQYTQGIGVSYNEEFHNWKDFMLLQYTLDIFRKEKKYWNKNKRKQNRVSIEK